MRKLLGLLLPILGLLAILLQATVLNRALPGSPWGSPISQITPDLIQLLCWVSALRWGMLPSMWAGFWGGLWLDLFVGQLGPGVLTYTFLGWMTGLAGELQPNPRAKELLYWGLASTLFVAISQYLLHWILVGQQMSIATCMVQFPGQMIWQLLSLLILAKLRVR